jgi:hypothetical protein
VCRNSRGLASCTAATPGKPSAAPSWSNVEDFYYPARVVSRPRHGPPQAPPPDRQQPPKRGAFPEGNAPRKEAAGPEGSCPMQAETGAICALACSHRRKPHFLLGLQTRALVIRYRMVRRCIAWFARDRCSPRGRALRAPCPPTPLLGHPRALLVMLVAPTARAQKHGNTCQISPNSSLPPQFSSTRLRGGPGTCKCV